MIVIKKDLSDVKVEENVESSAAQQPVQVDSKDVKIDDLTDTLKRLQAEFENYKKRVDKEHANNVKNSNAEIIKELLTVLDSFELALKNNGSENPEIAKYRKGLELIYSQLFATLEDYGLKIIHTKDQKFDPYKHEVLMVKECNEQDDKILQEFQKGYILNDTIIRHSKVMIAKHIEENKNK